MYKVEDCKENFRGKPSRMHKDGKVYLVRCPRCKKENKATIVATGICAWCNWVEAEEKKCS